jgi:YtcA-like protein
MRQDPSFDLFGSYFPSWMLCMAIGILATVLIRIALKRFDLEYQLAPPVLVYPAMAAFFCFILWLFFFGGR